MSAITDDEYFNNYNPQRTYLFNPPRPDGGLWPPYGGPTGGSGAAGARRFTDTLASGLGNIHPDGQVGWDWGKRRPLLGDTASQQDDENVTTEELRDPEASPEEMLSGNFSAMSFISVAQNFMMDAMHAAYIGKFA